MATQEYTEDEIIAVSRKEYDDLKARVGQSTPKDAQDRARLEGMLKEQSAFCAKIREALMDGAVSLMEQGKERSAEWNRRCASEFDYEFRNLLLAHGEMVQAPLMKALTEAAGMGYMMANKMQPIVVDRTD